MFITHLRAAHTGQFSAVLNGCAGQAFGDNRARGYVTVDTVNHCALKTPQDSGYFAPEGPATAQNVLWGDFYYVDKPNAFAQGENLVRLEAFPGTFSGGAATFYGRFVNHSGQDAREPLPATWAARYLNGGDFDGGGHLVVWRDSRQKVTPFACNSKPSWYPLEVADYVAFDEEENSEYLTPPPVDPTPPFPLDHLPAESNRIAVGTEAVPTPFDYGWIYVDLDLMLPSGAAPSQGWVGSVLDAEGIFSAGFNGTPLDRACVVVDEGSPRTFP